MIVYMNILLAQVRDAVLCYVMGKFTLALAFKYSHLRYTYTLDII